MARPESNPLSPFGPPREPRLPIHPAERMRKEIEDKLNPGRVKKRRSRRAR